MSDKISLVERHIISTTHKKWKSLDSICFLSKNLYNTALYDIKKHFLLSGKFIRYNELLKKLRLLKNLNYVALPNNSSQQILMIVDKNIRSYFGLLRKWKSNKKTLTGCPKFQKYKHPTKGRNIVVFTTNQVKIKLGYIIFPEKSKISKLKTNITELQQVRIIPQSSCYIILVVYKKLIIDKNLNKDNYLSIDLGINNLCAITGISLSGLLKPLLINGKIIKSINHYYNKKKAKIQSMLLKNHHKKWSNMLSKLQLKRNNMISNYMHHASKFIIEYCISNNVGNIVIGLNKQWKTNCNIGKRNNQTFMSIPFDMLIKMIEYKAKLNNINVILRLLNYTSICSALDVLKISKHSLYIGKRIKRGLFKTYSNVLINADVNGSLNILRKEIGDEFIQASANIGFVINPVKVNPLQNKQYIL